MKTLLRTLKGSAAILLFLGATASGSRAGDDTAAGPKKFDSAEAALAAVNEALKANDDEALKVLVGTGNDDLVQSGKDPLVAKERRRVAALIAEKIDWDILDDGTKVPVVGFTAWPMPIPFATKDGKWFLDAVQGRDELLARRVGKNELRVISIMRQLVEAQEAYKAKDRDGDGVLEYAQKFISTPGTHDGLFWVDADDVAPEDRSPLGALLEDLGPYADGKSKGEPFGGYLYKMVFAQDETARGGKMSFLDGENATTGFIIAAVPAQYRVTGVMSFMISHRNRLMQRNVGHDAVTQFKAATEFKPSGQWDPVVDDED